MRLPGIGAARVAGQQHVRPGGIARHDAHRAVDAVERVGDVVVAMPWHAALFTEPEDQHAQRVRASEYIDARVAGAIGVEVVVGAAVAHSFARCGSVAQERFAMRMRDTGLAQIPRLAGPDRDEARVDVRRGETVGEIRRERIVLARHEIGGVHRLVDVDAQSSLQTHYGHAGARMAAPRGGLGTGQHKRADRQSGHGVEQCFCGGGKVYGLRHHETPLARGFSNATRTGERPAGGFSVAWSGVGGRNIARTAAVAPDGSRTAAQQVCLRKPLFWPRTDSPR